MAALFRYLLIVAVSLATLFHTLIYTVLWSLRICAYSLVAIPFTLGMKANLIKVFFLPTAACNNFKNWNAEALYFNLAKS